MMMACFHSPPGLGLGRKRRKLLRHRVSRRAEYRTVPRFDWLEWRRVMSAADPFGALAIGLPTDPTISVSGSISASGAQNVYAFSLDNDANLQAQLHPAGFDTLLSLLDDQGRILIESEASTPTNRDSELDQSLPAGNYYIAVAGRLGTGNYDLAIKSTIATTTTRGGVSTPVAESKHPVVVGDFDNTGISDMIVANPDLGTISIFEGQGEGTFLLASSINVGGRPSGLVAADFNGDGRLDLGVSDEQNNEVLILRGVADGTFLATDRYRVGASPDSLVAVDLNGDGELDLATADRGSNDVSLLLGNGSGAFTAAARLPVGAAPISVVAADLNKDGKPDLVTANQGSGDLTFLWNTGAGTFRSASWQSTSMVPSALVASDLDGDGYADVVVADKAGNRIVVLWGSSDAHFSRAGSFAVGEDPEAIVASDLDGSGDGSHDLIVCDHGSQEISIFRGWMNGSYKHAYQLPLRGTPGDLVVGALNGDLIPDLAVVDSETGQADVYLGGGDGIFTSPASTVPLPHSVPLVVDDGSVITIDKYGQLLLRNSRPGLPGEYDSPIVVTADGSGNTARQVVPVATDLGTVYAVIDVHRPLLIMGRPLPDGEIVLTYQLLPGGGIYTRLASGDFDKDGRDDIAVLDRASNRVLIYHQDATGEFSLEGSPIGVGFGPTDLTIADVNQDSWPDIIVANGSSGDISVIHGGPGGQFSAEIRLRGGLCLGGTVALNNGLARSTPDEPIGVTTGIFDPSGLTDVVVVQRGADQISLLKGTPGGGMADPSLATSYATGSHPVQAVAAQLGFDGRLDLAVLNEGSRDISIFMNNGHGGFITMPRVDAGDHPTGLAIHDVDGDGIADLLVGNDAGDLLILLGNGDGTFRPYVRADHTMHLAVGDLNGDGQLDFVFSDASRDLLSVQFPGGAHGFVQGRDNGLLAPGPVQIADVNGDRIPDLVVTSRGANEMFVYLGLGQSQFAAPKEFFTGTSPSSLTISDLNGDQIPDFVITNAGSNDVSIFLGRGQGSDWTVDTGPRLRVGQRPINTTVVDANGDGVKDIFCVDQDSNTVTLLLGRGGGFFNDQNPRTFATGPAPIQAFFGRFSANPESGLVTIDSLSSTMTYYPTLNSVPAILSSGGVNPIAGVMGDFNNDGFSDLVVADGGDAKVVVFAGGGQGLVATNTVDLGSYNQLTGLAFLPTATGGFQLFVSTTRDSQAIAVPLTFGGYSQAIGQPLAGGLASPVGFSSNLGSSNGSSALSFTLSSLDVGARSAGLQGQNSAQASSQTGGSSTQTTTSEGPVAQAISSFLGGSVSSLSGLLDFLVRSKQAQSSDALPLDDQDVALIAVIQSVTRALDFGEGGNDSTPTEENRNSTDESDVTSGTPHVSHASAVERLLANAEAGLSTLPLDLGERAVSQEAFGTEWVWRQPLRDLRQGIGVTGTGVELRGAQAEVESEGTLNSLKHEKTVEESKGQDEHGRGVEQASTLREGALVAVSVAVTAVAICKGLGIDIVGKLRAWARRWQTTANTSSRRRVLGTPIISGARIRLQTDLPPWLQISNGKLVGRRRWCKLPKSARYSETNVTFAERNG